MRLRGASTSSWLVGVAVLFHVATGGLAGSGAASGPYTEYQHRAWYLYLIAQYTTWPAEAFPDDKTPFVLGILGDNPFGNNLDVIRDKPIKRRPLRIRTFKRVEDIDVCHALYICDSEKARVAHILRHLAGRPILTFGSLPGFRKNQGIVKLWVRQESSQRGYLYFEINQAAAAQAGLRISSYVLKLAKPAPPSR